MRSPCHWNPWLWSALLVLRVLTPVAAAPAVMVDLSAHDPGCGVNVRAEGSQVVCQWAAAEGELLRVVVDLDATRPLIPAIAVGGDGREWRTVLGEVSPAFWLTVGSRVGTPGRPPEMSPFNEFFDNPAKRPYQTHLARLELRRARVSSDGRRATLTLGELTAGSFTGEIVFTFFPGSRLFRVEAVLTTGEDLRAFFYDAGLVGNVTAWSRLAWKDTAGVSQTEEIRAETPARRLAVRHRTLMAESTAGALAVFPPPHQFQFPRDWTDNLKFVWMGRPHETSAAEFGMGICEHATGGGPFVPWFNAPPGTRQRLGFFCLVTPGRADKALEETLRFTHGDRFPRLPGHLTFTSHYHMAIAVASLERASRGQLLHVPDFVRVFKDLGVDLVHLAEFHGDGHQFDSGKHRLPELEAMFNECRRLSDQEILFIPGEELNTYLGLNEPGKHPGHWMSLFPRPVHWILKRSSEEPYVEDHARYGKLYRVGSREDVERLLADENGLAWAAHPRIKASSWTPDIFRHESFYLSERWLGAAWKAMPGDLSRPKLGERCLDLLDDMANWGVTAPAGTSPGGRRKYLPGEVDVFKIDRAHELYAHMNINYLPIDQLPRFEQGWQSVLDALRAGSYFVTTGEVILQEVTVGGAKSGETLRLKPDGRAELRARLNWTFPLEFAEVISGDGENVFRERIALLNTEAFGQQTLTRTLELRGRRWVRLEVWDTAVNGAYTQPVWIEE